MGWGRPCPQPHASVPTAARRAPIGKGREGLGITPGPPSKSQPHWPPAHPSLAVTATHFLPFAQSWQTAAPVLTHGEPFLAGGFDPCFLPPQGSACRAVQSGIHRMLVSTSVLGERGSRGQMSEKHSELWPWLQREHQGVLKALRSPSGTQQA